MHEITSLQRTSYDQCCHVISFVHQAAGKNQSLETIHPCNNSNMLPWIQSNKRRKTTPETACDPPAQQHQNEESDSSNEEEEEQE